MSAPQDQAARAYMARKDYPFIEPRDVTKLDGIPCWYYVYDLDNDGLLELEVSWDGREWQTVVTAFRQDRS